MRVAILGAGYVGACTAAVLAEHGHEVVVADPDARRVEALAAGRAPAYEPGLDEAIAAGARAGRLTATRDTIAAVRGSGLTFLCVGTPSTPSGGHDLRYVRAAARQVGEALKRSPGWHCVVTKSTVPPGTTERVVGPAVARASGRKPGEGFGLAVNPEFLREGSAMADARRPDRIVVGQLDAASGRAVWNLYEGIEAARLTTSLGTAEMVKVATNAFLAAKVGMANEVANVCAAVGLDAAEVLRGVGMDPRIGPQFLRAGAGFGGSCFPKDARALLHVSREAGKPSRIVDAVLKGNEAQPLEAVRLARAALGTLKGRRIALLGLSFKADTDDVRETRALPIWEALVEAGAEVVCHDPRAGPNFQALAGRSARVVSGLEEALEGADCAIVQAEWSAYRSLAADDLVKRMRRPLVVDARRALDGPALRAGGVDYRAIGLGSPPDS